MASLIINDANDNRPYIEVQVFEKTIKGLLDSGANVTILGKGSDQLIKTLNIETRTSSTTIKTADGTSHEATTYANIPFIYNNKRRVIPTLIMPTISKELILGTDFWDAFKIRAMVCETIDAPKITNVSGRHELTPEQEKQLQEVIKTFPFVKAGEKLGFTTLVEHHIDTGDAHPIRQRQYVMSPYVQEKVNEEIDRMLEKDIIEPVADPEWLNPVVPVTKTNGRVRLCINAKKLNNVTKKSAYPQPNANRILSRLQGTKYLTSIDLSDAFYQILLSPHDRSKTAFTVGSKGTFQYKRMPMGLCNSGCTLCRLVDRLFGNKFEPEVFTYIDDFIVATKTFERHLELLWIISRIFNEAGLSISREKSHFCMTRLEYLGYIIDQEGIHANQERVKPIVEYPRPKSIKEIRRFTGMAGWYRRFIKGFSEISAPITELLKGRNRKFAWTDEAEQAFTDLKTALCSAPVLTTPDFSKPFVITCDASNMGMGGVLSQVYEDQEKVIAYMSAKFTAAQRKYHVTERECLAVISSIEKFRPYIEGAHFTVITDHASLLWLQNVKDPTGRFARWALRLQAYDFDLIHRKGKLMCVPDALSRSVELIELEKIKSTSDQWYLMLRKNFIESPESYPYFQIKNGTILKYCRHKKNDQAWKILIPADARKDILIECHDSKLAAHGGFHKTLQRIKQNYYWPKMVEDIKKYVRNCDICRATKPRNEVARAPMGKYRDAVRPWRMITLDFCGPYPLTNSRNRFLLVVVDSFSKFVSVKPMTQSSAADTIRFLKNEIFLKFGVPEIVISDNGPQLRSNLFNDFLNQYNVKHWKTASYHPQANATEAANKTVVNAIRAYIADITDQRNWDANLSEIACAVNSSIHSSTGNTPYSINFGHEMALDGAEYEILIDPNHNTHTHETRFDRIRKEVAKKLRESYEKSKKRYDLRSRNIEYKPGETVWLKNFRLSNAGQRYAAKLDHKFLKCIISKRIGTNTYAVNDQQGKFLGNFSTLQLKSDRNKL